MRRSLPLLLLFAALAPSLTASGQTVTERSMERQGMVKIADVDSTILVSLMYARPDNCTGHVLYTDLHTAYLHPRAARALHRAQRILRSIRPDLTLKVYDAARPMSVQAVMWKAVEGTSKDIYVSNPAHGGGLHNYGLAVDITLADSHISTVPRAVHGIEPHVPSAERRPERCNGLIELLSPRGIVVLAPNATEKFDFAHLVPWREGEKRKDILCPSLVDSGKRHQAAVNANLK